MLAILWILTTVLLQAPAPERTTTLDFNYFRTKVQPIFLTRRPGHARCYACHSQGTPFRLQALSDGSQSWDEDQSRRNYEAALRVVVPGNPEKSALIRMPLATEAGGVRFHPGGKHWSSSTDSECQVIAAWIRGATGSD